MKQYKVNQEAINKIIMTKIIGSIPKVAFALGFATLYAYYLHPRGPAYKDWPSFFSDSSTALAGIAGGAALFIGYVYGFLTSRTALTTLVLTVTDEHFAWEHKNNPEGVIPFHDMAIKNTSQGLIISSKSNKKLVVEVPFEINDFKELETTLKKSI
jgi:hypothetical protein